MAITIKSRTDAFNSMKSYLQTLTTNLTDFNTGSVLLSIFDCVAAEIEQLYNAQAEIQNMAFISTATGDDLDLKVADFTLVRRGATYATGILTFGRTTGSSQDYVIPLGTTVSTTSTTSTSGIQFETTEEAILPANSLTVNVNAQCKEFGVTGNVTSNSIIILPSPPAGIEFVINYADFSGGAEAETDEELRSRLALYLNSLARGTKLALESAALSVTGITSVSISDNDPTPGYVKMYVADASGTATTDEVDAVKAVVEDYRPVGVIVLVYAPVAQNIDVTCYISVDSTYDQATVFAAVQAVVENYIGKLKLNEVVNRAAIIETIMGVDGVTDLDTTVEQKQTNEAHTTYITPVVDEAQTSLDRNRVRVNEAAWSVAGVFLAYDTGKVGKNFFNGVLNRDITTIDLPIVNEQQTSVSTTQVDVNYDIGAIDTSGPALTRDGVWDNPAHTGTNYFLPGGYFSGKTITLGTPLPSGNMVVYTQYTEAGTGVNTLTDVLIDYNKQQVDVMFAMSDVEGVWLSSDTLHTGTNYYVDGSFTNIGSYTITLGTTTAYAVDTVNVSYWQITGSQGLMPYDNVAVQPGRVARPRTITVNLIT